MRHLLLLSALLGLLATAPACDPSTFFLLAPLLKGSGDNGEPFAQPRDVDALRREMLDLINDARETKDLIPLAANTTLHAVAQQHSNDMVQKNFLNHNGSDGSTPEVRVKRALGEPAYVGQNIAAGFRTIQLTHDAFMKSKENRDNILSGAATQVGIGIAFGDEDNQYKDGAYITVVFFAPK